jgi:hypothetical protein
MTKGETPSRIVWRIDFPAIERPEEPRVALSNRTLPAL